jgi:hypothetical protein
VDDIFCDSVADKKLKWRRSLAETGRFNCSEKSFKAEIPGDRKDLKLTETARN